MKTDSAHPYKHILVVGLLIAISGISFGVPISEDQQSRWVDFKSKYGENWSVLWNYKTGTPDLIYGFHYNITENISDENKAEKIAKNIISDNAKFLGIDDETSLKIVKIERGNGKWYIDARQYYAGLPVLDGKIGMTIADNYGLVSLGSEFYPGINIHTEPTLSKNEAIAIAKKEISFLTESEEVSLAIFPEIINDTITYHLVWKFALVSTNPLLSETFFVDAAEGKIRNKYSNIVSSNYEAPDVRKTSSSNKVIIVVVFALLLFLFWAGKKFKR